jgi:mono/diheme cytochrome c family protein
MTVGQVLMAGSAAATLAACGGGGERAGEAAPPRDTTAAAVPAAPAGAGGAVSGQQVYQRTCGTCHQANGRGMPNAFPPIAGSPFATGDKGRLIRIVLHGLSGPLTVEGTRYNGVMPPWKTQLNDREIAAVLTYVRSNFGNNAGPVTEEEVRAERAATASRSTMLTAAELGEH